MSRPTNRADQPADRAVGAEYRELLDTGAVHVWQGSSAGLLDPADAALLSDEELLVVRRRSQEAGTRYAGAHAALRRILARYLGTPPEAIRFGRRPCPRCEHPEHGRPRVSAPDTGLDFNLSRSGPHWIVAVTAGRQVGIDLEDARSLDVDGSAELMMSRAELRHLRGQSTEAGRTAAFFRCWTRKEAVVKASGVGILTDLRALDVQPAREGPVSVRHEEPTGPTDWIVQDVPAAPHLFAALAREAGSTGPVVVRHDDASGRAPAVPEGAVST
ncbi:4'-phosphopantetheinyl transferase family protein [Streptomyces sp. NPDC008313]|uniref:4'-phosphopantetheinyl transferase family protein n=1 Tax=Streptomyces sp. NPDC008313 TaxID=3364826 RepID=UPI0036E7E4CC